MAIDKCSICGGDLIKDYRTGICKCDHCANEWPLSQIDQDYQEYAPIIEQLRKADELVSGEQPERKQLESAILIYKNTIARCHTLKQPEAALSIRQQCEAALTQCNLYKDYETAKHYFEHGSFKQARELFSKLGSFKDSAQLAAQCIEGEKIEKRKRIPYCIFVGMILPLLLFLFLKEKIKANLWLCATISVTGAVADILLIYRDNGFSKALEIISFILLIPILLFAFFAYILHLSVALSAGLSVGVPLALIVLFTILQNFTKS